MALRRWITGAVLAAGIVAAGWAGRAFLHRAAPAGTNASEPSASLYADPTTCADCHGAIAATYRKTGMGRSFSKLKPETVIENFSAPATFHHESSDSYFQMIERDGKYFQRRWQIGFDGKETNVDEKQIDFVLGSGNHARSYLHLTDRNTLQELPLGWYAEKGGYWGMNPGFDRADYPGSVRPIFYECMFCHNGYPKIPEASQRDRTETQYVPPLPEGIDCQRCHGPGQKHVDMASAGAPVDQIRAAITNPARLSPKRQMEVCLQCHLETTSLKLPHSIRNIDREPFSYKPGEPLGDFSIAFDRAEGLSDRFEIAQGAYRLGLSKCFRNSKGPDGEPNLRCTSCHDPHNIPRGEAALAHYNGVCLNCHRAEVTRPGGFAAHNASANCVGCHMPKRRTDDAVHTVMTDHDIVRRKPAGNLLADKPEEIESPATARHGEVVPYYPEKLPDTVENALYVAVAQVREQSNLKNGLPLLKSLIDRDQPKQAGFYADLADGYLAAGDPAMAIQYFEEAAKKEPRVPLRQLSLGNAFMEAQQWPQAEAALRRATDLAPGDPRGWGRLGWVLWQQNKSVEAKAALEKALSLDPEIPDVHNNLGLLLWGTGDPAGAIQEFRAALRTEPGIAEWRLNLARALASQGSIPEARYQFQQSLRLKPDYGDARIDYAHLLASQGDANGSLRELQTATRLQPDLWRAQYELGMALGTKGDVKSAVEHLRIAAAGADPQARAAALQVLQQLRQ